MPVPIVALAAEAVCADVNELRLPVDEEVREVVAFMALEALRTPPTEAPAPMEALDPPPPEPELEDVLDTEPPMELEDPPAEAPELD